MTNTRTSRSLGRLRLQLAALFTVTTALALGVLVAVVLNTDADLRWASLNEVLLSRAQAVSAVIRFDTDGRLVTDRFTGDEDLRDAWPQAVVFEIGGTAPVRVAGPSEDWYQLELRSVAEAVASDAPTGAGKVGSTDEGEDIFGRGVALVDPTTGGVGGVVIAVVRGVDIYADHEQLKTTMLVSTVLLALLAAGAGYWLAGRGTRTTAAALEQQERLLADAAHELRTPVARMRSVAEGGLAGDEPVADALASVARISIEAGGMVDDLLVLARMDAGREPVSRTPLRLDQLTEAVAGDFPDVELEMVETVVRGDPGLLRRAVANLVRNAVIHGGPPVRVTVYPSVLIVADRGPGIDPAVADRVFERFHTGSASRGHGLGLPMVRWIADAHGATITLRPREGGGTEAILRFA